MSVTDQTQENPTPSSPPASSSAPPSRRRTRMSGDERREQLLDATRDIVGERGFQAISIESVAQRAGITRPIIYGHFGNLEGLLNALLEREAGRAGEQLAAFLPTNIDQESPAETLLGGLRGYLEAVQADPFTWRLVLMPPEGAPELLRDRITETRALVLDVLAKALGPGFGTGREMPDPELAAHAISALSDSWAKLVLTDPDKYPIERILIQARWFFEEIGMEDSKQ